MRQVGPTERARGSDSGAPAKSDALALSILMVTSEAHPFAKTGGLAEVAGGAAAARSRASVTASRSCSRGIAASNVGDEGHADLLSVSEIGRYRCRSSSSSRRPESRASRPCSSTSPELFDRDGLYGEARRRLPRQRVALRGPEPRGARVRAAAKARALRHSRARLADRPRAGVPEDGCCRRDPVVGGVPVVFTIHNLAFQGVFPASTGRLDRTWAGNVLDVQAMEYWGQISYLKGGHQLQRADHHRQPDLRARDPDAGARLRVRRRPARGAPSDLAGILNGIDVDALEPGSGRVRPGAPSPRTTCRERRPRSVRCSRRPGCRHRSACDGRGRSSGWSRA